MAFAGNLLWFVIGGGIVAWLFWIVLGALMAITIIGIPFAKADWSDDSIVGKPED